MNYTHIFQFNNNLSDDNPAGAGGTVVSGLPAYNASPNGNALDVSSAQISLGKTGTTVYQPRDELGIVLKIATGVTDGTILSQDSELSSSQIARWALSITGGNLRFHTYGTSTTTQTQNITGWSLDTWFLLRIGKITLDGLEYRINGATSNTDLCTSDLATNSYWSIQHDHPLYVGYASSLGTGKGLSASGPTGVEIDWLYLSENYAGNADGGSDGIGTDTLGTAARTFEAWPAATDFAVTEATEHAQVELPDLTETDGSEVTTVDVTESAGEGAGGGVVVKEFWS